MHYRALATDYDGTLAEDGHVDEATLDALRRLRGSGRAIVLVTGRELRELQETFPQLGLCDLVVAENGALLYSPDKDRQQVLGEPPPEAFIAEMSRREVKPFAVGRVIFATWRPHESAVLEVIQQLGIGYQIIFNKRAVMVLPAQINKATGLVAALEQLELEPDNVVGIGDAENDHAFLDACGVAVAVDNALDALKQKCDLVTAGDHGRGVIELVDRILADDLASLGPRHPRAKMKTRSIEHSSEND